MLVGIAAPLIVVILWGRFAAPRATRRLPLRFRAPFELSGLALAALALLTASSAAAIAFASVFIINSVLLAVLLRSPREPKDPLTALPRASRRALIARLARQARAEQLYEQFVGGVDAVGIFERVEIHQEPTYDGERERC